MADNQKKVAVLYQLNQENSPISLSELLAKLGGRFLERSVRRWLLEMTKQGLVQKIGAKRSTKYQIARTTWPYQTTTGGLFSLQSKDILNAIRKPIYERKPVAYVEEWLNKYQPNQTYYLPLTLRLQLRMSGKRLNQEEPAGTYAHQIFNRLLINLSYNSSRLEGNTYSLLDTQKLLFEGFAPEGKLDEERAMILNHKEAIRFLVDSAHRLEMTKETFLTIHYLLSDGLVDPRYAGRIRDQGVKIGGSVYIPFENPRDLEHRFDGMIKKAEQILDPYEQSFFLLVHISYLQAFIDVNKRTARLCANIPLIKNNLVPLSFNDVEKDDYISAMIAVYELQDIRPLCDLYVFSYLRSCLLYDATTEALGFDEIRVRYRQLRRTLVREVILNQITGQQLKEYIHQQALQRISEKDREAFMDDVNEDLQTIDSTRIVGLGITLEELRNWTLLRDKSPL